MVWFVKSLAATIRERRETLGLSQEALAARLGIRQTQVSAIEHGRTRVTADRLKALAQALGVTSDHLLGLDAAPPAKPKRGRSTRKP